MPSIKDFGCNISWHRQHVTPTSSSEPHPIRPSDTSTSYAAHHRLVPFREWINLTHRKTFIHGPFDFATVRGCKSRDRIAQIDWDVLVSHKDMLQNEIPRFDLPSYSIHVDRGAHVAYIDASASAQISSAADGSPLFGDDEWRRLQKVFVSISNPTPL